MDIIGLIVGSIFVILIIVLVICYLKRRKSNPAPREIHNQDINRTLDGIESGQDNEEGEQKKKNSSKKKYKKNYYAME